MRGLQRGAGGGEALGLRLRLGQLDRETLGPAAELRLPLAQLTGVAHEIHALGRHAACFEPQRLQPVTVRREAGAMRAHRRFEIARHLGTLGPRPLGFGERGPRAFTLSADGARALGAHADILLQPHGLLRHLARLHAHLLTALQQALQLALHLLHGLPQVGQAVIALLQQLALATFPRAERRQPGPQPGLAVA
jgi:hypothetical protein